MYLSIGVLFLSLTVFLYCIAVIGTRNPKQSWWAKETMISYIISPMIVGMLAMGVSFLLQSLVPEHRPSAMDLAIAGGIAVGSLAIFQLLGIKKKMAKHKVDSTSDNVFPGDFTDNPKDSNNHPAAPSGNMRKAA